MDGKGQKGIEMIERDRKVQKWMERDRKKEKDR